MRTIFRRNAEWTRPVAFSLAVALPLLVGTVMGGSTQAHHGVMIPSRAGQTATVGATEDSLNWSGYADLPPHGHRVTAVKSSFFVPAVDQTTPGFASTWTGIGGFNSSDLIQAGVEEDYLPGLGADYYAWYEILPDFETPITKCTGDAKCTVRPGDAITVSIKVNGPIQKKQAWRITISNAGKWSWTKTLTYASTYSSAEWILEAPTVAVQSVMPMMGISRFEPSNTFALDNGTSRTIAAGSQVRITMNQFEGIPSALDRNGDGFNACAYATSCPTPAS